LTETLRRRYNAKVPKSKRTLWGRRRELGGRLEKPKAGGLGHRE
jgi:hypothetical protein